MSASFIGPDQQIQNVIAWARLFDPDSRLKPALDHIPKPPPWPKANPSCKFPVLVLVPYWPLPTETFRNLWCAISHQQERAMVGCHPLTEVITNSISWGLVECPAYPFSQAPLFRWEIIDLQAEYYPVGSGREPHAAIMAAAAHFPDWISGPLHSRHIRAVLIPGFYIPQTAGHLLQASLVWDGEVLKLTTDYPADQCRHMEEYFRPAFIRGTVAAA